MKIFNCEYYPATYCLLSCFRYDDAADAIRRELGLHQQNESYQAAGRLTVALVLVQLARGDVVAAEKAFKEWGKTCITLQSLHKYVNIFTTVFRFTLSEPLLMVNSRVCVAIVLFALPSCLNKSHIFQNLKHGNQMALLCYLANITSINHYSVASCLY